MKGYGLELLTSCTNAKQMIYMGGYKEAQVGTKKPMSLLIIYPSLGPKFVILIGGVIPLIQQGLICVLLFSDVAEDEHGMCLEIFYS